MTTITVDLSMVRKKLTAPVSRFRRKIYHRPSGAVLAIRTIGTYQKKQKFGVYCVVEAELYGRTVQAEIQLTPATMSREAATEVAEQVLRDQSLLRIASL